MTLVVRTADLAKLLDEFLKQNYVNPEDARVFGFLTPREYLDEWGIHYRVVYRILKQETQWTTLAGRGKQCVADKILIAIDKVEALYNGELEVFDVDLATGRVKKENTPEPKKRPPVPNDVPTKKCPGPLCQGHPRPLKKFALKGRNTEKRLAQCEECHRYRQRVYDQRYSLRRAEKVRATQERHNRDRRTKHGKDWKYYGFVPVSKVSMAIEIVCNRLGPKEASRRLGVSPQMLWRYRTDRSRSLHKQHAMAILRLAYSLVQTGEKWSFDDKRFGRGAKRTFVRDELGYIQSWGIIHQEEASRQEEEAL